MTGEDKGAYSRDPKTLCRDYGEKAVQFCISEWNQLCPQYQLTNVTEVMHRKRWLFSGPDVVILKQSGGCGQISRLALGVNRRLTAKALRKHKDSPLVIVNCWIRWNCETKQVRGWSSHISIDVTKDCVARFPHVTPATPHVHCCPLP